MPIYEYICDSCIKKVDLIRPIRDRDKPVICPNCVSRMRRAMSNFSHYWFNPMFVDGEGFTSKMVRHEEVAEMNQECRER